LFLSFLCPVVSPIKGIYYFPTHHWAGEEVCDSFHIPHTARVGKEKDGKILLFPRQSGREGGTWSPRSDPLHAEKWAAAADTSFLAGGRTVCNRGKGMEKEGINSKIEKIYQERQNLERDPRNKARGELTVRVINKAG